MATRIKKVVDDTLMREISLYLACRDIIVDVESPKYQTYIATLTTLYQRSNVVERVNRYGVTS